MAKATTVKTSQFLVLIGDGATPENFAAPCGVTTRGFERTASMNETVVPDCDDEDAVAWVERDVVSMSAGLPFAGVLATESVDTWDAWMESGDTKNIRIELGQSPLRAWQGPAKLQSFNITGERGRRVAVAGTIVSDGPIVRQTS